MLRNDAFAFSPYPRSGAADEPSRLRYAPRRLDTQESREAAETLLPTEERLGLFVVFAVDAPELLGTWLPLGRPGETFVFGRGGPAAGDPHPRLLPIKQRPQSNEPAAPLQDPFVSQVQLQLVVTHDGIAVTNLGKRELLDGNGRIEKRVVLAPGQIAEVRGRLLLLAGRRPPELPPARSLPKKKHPFGEPDADGLVGESLASWKLRDVVAFVAGRPVHVLLLGESGTGKEIVANAIHRLSDRRGKRLVSRNAATLPPGVIDAELFGHVANYPNAGMPERPGLVAEADGSTLFLDEIGELPHDLSTKLLRVLDEKGEYQRLGDSRMRTSDFRLIAATNRAASSIKEDVAARFRLRVVVPTLTERREDIPLLVRHLLRRAAQQDPAIGERFFAGWDGRTGEPRISADLMRQLVLHSYRTHIRELDLLLWSSLASSPDDTALLTPEVKEALSEAASEESATSSVDIATLTAEDVRVALERANGVYEKAWRDLGLANRHVLRRLVRKFGLREE